MEPDIQYSILLQHRINVNFVMTNHTANQMAPRTHVWRTSRMSSHRGQLNDFIEYQGGITSLPPPAPPNSDATAYFRIRLISIAA